MKTTENYFDADYYDRLYKFLGLEHSDVRKSFLRQLGNTNGLVPTFENASLSQQADGVRTLICRTTLDADINHLVIPFLKTGDTITLALDDNTFSYSGKVVRINFNSNTQEILVEDVAISGVAASAPNRGTTAIAFDQIWLFGQIRENFMKKVRIPKTAGEPDQGTESIYDLYIYPESSIFREPHAFNAGQCDLDFRFTVRSKVDVARYLLQSKISAKALTTDFLLSIEDVRIIVPVIRKAFNGQSALQAHLNRTKYFKRMEYILREEIITAGETEKTVRIKGHTKGIAIAFSQLYENTTTPWNVFEKGDFEIYNNIEQLQLIYNKKEFPKERYEFNASGSNDGMQRLHIETQNNLGYSKEYAEEFEEWVKRGIYMYVPINDITEGDKSLRIRFRFGSGLTGNYRMYVLHIHGSLVEMTIKNGVMTNIETVGI
ncbi:MAG TPA: hypothetical protein ENG48_12330 [Candidatus Atribacteria bacterium]|nr:hypothetical protein [Candidatus Atribacteria bacterium]